MKIEIQAIITLRGGKPVFIDETGNEISPSKMLLKKYLLKDGDQVPCLILADDGKTEPEFDIAKAKLILARKQPWVTENVIVTKSDGPVKIYTTGAAGEYPIVGLDPENRPCCWTLEGAAIGNNRDLDIVIKQKQK